MASTAANPGAASPLHKLQLLADVMAHDFSLSQASQQAAGTLCRLLPSLCYLSIGVSNPVQGGMIVAAANCAAEGPTTLHLHDPHACAAGVALARGQPLQASLLNGAADTAAAAWSDVQLMLAQAPGVTHLLCIPFGPGGSDGSSEQASPPACQHHAGSPGSGAGALLFGFAAAPQLDERRRAVLALLARCLPAPMARLSGDTLAFVNFATGSSLQCSCCCGAEEEEEEEEAGPSERCAPPSRPDGRGDDGAAPSQALRVSRPSDDCAGPSSVHGDDVQSDKLLAAAGEAAGSAAREECAALDEPKLSLQLSSPRLSGSEDPGSCPSSPCSSLRFSKALVRAAEEQGDAIVQQSPLTLTFRSPLAEAEYGRWAASMYRKGDILFSLLLLSSLAIIAFVRPYRLVEFAPGTLALAFIAFVPMQLAWLHCRTYLTWREWLVAAFRLLAVAFISMVCMRAYQLNFDRLQQWITFWRLTGAESLCVTAIGFRTRMQLHLSLQLAALALAGWNLASVCNHVQCYPHVAPSACLKGAAAAAAGFGYLLPTAGLRFLEQRSRSLFASRLQAAAAHER